MKLTADDYPADFPEDLKETVEAFEKFCDDGEHEMAAKWRNQSFRFLLEAWENSESEWASNYEELGYEVLVLRNRYEDIMNMMERSRVWPPPLSSWSHKFRAALREVLSRLPQEAFDKVENEVGFILDEPCLKRLALNAPASSPGLSRTIVFLRTSMNLSKEALIGLIAREISHISVQDNDCQTSEKLAENQARAWRFGAELDCKETENDSLYSNDVGPDRFKGFTKSLLRP